jgi:phosphohistidine phosphatase
MRLYLVQHGNAKSEEEDIQRPLSAKGKMEVEKVAKYAAGLNFSIAGIYHSPKLRAKQTAEILMKALKSKASEFQDLKPNDDPSIARDLIETEAKDLMLVGHLPHLDRLSSLLLSGKAETGVVSFRMGAIVCLEKEDKWRVKWILTPEMVQ